MGRPDRVALLRETYRLNHELGYIGFRHQYFNDPDAIKEWPDPAARERELRNFWDKEREGRFASYNKDFGNDSVKVLTAYRDYLRGLLAGDKDSQVNYYDRVSDMGRSIRLHEEGFSEVKSASQPLPSPAAIADDRDDIPTPEEWQKLKAEWKHDYGLRHLEDRGVSYKDEGECTAVASKARLPSPSEIARDNSPAAPEPGNGHDNRRGR